MCTIILNTVKTVNKLRPGPSDWWLKFLQMGLGKTCTKNSAAIQSPEFQPQTLFNILLHTIQAVSRKNKPFRLMTITTYSRSWKQPKQSTSWDWVLRFMTKTCLRIILPIILQLFKDKNVQCYTVFNMILNTVQSTNLVGALVKE